MEWSTPKASPNDYFNKAFQQDNTDEDLQKGHKHNYESSINFPTDEHPYEIPNNVAVHNKKKCKKCTIIAIIASIVVLLLIAVALGIVFSGILAGISDSVVDSTDSTTPVSPVTGPPNQKPLWTTWGQWSNCDVTCAGGMQQRSRICVDPIPSDDLSCVGKPMEQQSCADWGCPDPSRVCSDGSLNNDYDACECVGSKLSGRVMDASNRPLSNAKIYYSTRPYKELATTDSTGTFEADNVCSTPQLFLVKKDMFSSVEIYSQVDSSLMPTLNATLQRIELPYITQQPEHKVRQEGDGVRFCCIAESVSPIKKFEWFKDDDIIETPNSDGESLVIENLSASDAGTYKCRVENEMGAIYSEPATLTIIDAIQPTCTPQPHRHFISLPGDCMQPDTNKTEYDVGTCGQKECLSTTKTDQTSCTDSEQEFECCQPVESNVIDIQCDGYTIPVTKVVWCGCGECMKPRRKVIGRVLNADSGEELDEISVYYNSTLVTGTNMGRFTFEVPSQVQRIALTLKDDLYYPLPSHFMDTTVVLNIGDGLVTYKTIRMKPVPAPHTVEDSAVENCIPLLGEGAEQIAELVIAPDSLYDSAGNRHHGSFDVTVKVMDMRNITDAEIAPGDFTTVDEEGNLAELKSYGMFSFDFTNMSGSPLQVGGSSMVRVNQDMIPTCTFDEDGNCGTSLWWFNERSGTWELESKLRDTGGGRRRRQNGPNNINGNIDGRVVWYNIDDIVSSDRCWGKVIAYTDEDLNPDRLLPNTFTVTSIIEENGSNFLRRNLDWAVTRNDVGVCVPQACDGTNPNNSKYPSRLTVDFNDYALTPAVSNMSPRFILSESDVNQLQYSTMDTQLSIKPFATEDGPVFPGKRSGCDGATTSTKHFQFFCSTCYDVKCYTTEESAVSANQRTYLTYYPLLPTGIPQEYCFIGVRIYTSSQVVRIIVTSEVGDSAIIQNLANGGKKGDNYGRRELLARKENANSQFIDTCMEFKCSGELFNPRPTDIHDTTKVTLDVQDTAGYTGRCLLYDATPDFKAHLNANGVGFPANLPITFPDSQTYGLNSGLHKQEAVEDSGECRNDDNSPQSSSTDHCVVSGQGYIPAVTINCVRL